LVIRRPNTVLLFFFTTESRQVRDPHVDSKRLEELRLGFASLFAACVTTNIYTSGAEGSVGFVEHHDPHDVFAIQLDGAKRWYVGPPTVQFPSHRYEWTDAHCTTPADMQCFEATPGHMLYIPLGWRHYAVPAAESDKPRAFSVHMTMGVQLPRWIDAIQAAVHCHGATNPTLRQPLVPTFAWGDGLGPRSFWLANGADLAVRLRALADMVEAKSCGDDPEETETPDGAVLRV
jgi:hypothetical protein